MDKYKEVFFHEYCPKCVNADTSSTKKPCDTCLEHPYNIDSHKPTEFKPKE